VTEIDTLFDLLDAWRHFPSYQLERRADLYFALYLPEVLEAQFGFPAQPQLVPEFPLRIGILDPAKATSASYKVDYVTLSTARDKALLVELKTDSLSRRFAQSLRERALAPAVLGLPGQVWVALDEDLAAEAAQLGAEARLRGAAAVYAAGARRYGAALITRDQQPLERLAPWYRC
jgi:hypothetical protein